MADSDDFFQALQMFERGVKQLQFSRTLSSANEAVQQIRMSEAKEEEKRTQLQQLAQQFVLSATAQGADTQAIQQASQSIAPPQDTTLQRQLALEHFKSGLRQQEAKNKAMLKQRATDDIIALQDAATQGNKRAIAKLPKNDRERLVPGYGFAVDASNARKFRTELGEGQAAISGIDEVMKLYNQSGGQISKLNPKTRAKIDSTLIALKGALRLGILGPGAVTDAERKILDSAVPNPAEFINVFGPTRLQQLQTVIQSNLDNKASAIGLSAPNRPSQPPQTSSSGGLRQFLRPRS